MRGEDVADAVVRGRIVRYDLTAPPFRGNQASNQADVLQRQVSIRVEVELIELPVQRIVDGAQSNW